MRVRRLLAVALLFALVACAAATVEPPTTEPTTTTSTTTSTLVPSTTTTLPGASWEFSGPIEGILVALITTDVDVYESPETPTPHRVVEGVTFMGTTTVMAVVDEPIDGWVEVILPGRPNGATGWIKTDGVHFYVAGGRIVIDLSARELVYYVDGEELLRSTVAIGTDRHPTPTGVYYVTDSVEVSNPNGPWGPFALALSGRSDTITEFNGGDGIIGIHGTNRPSSIGQAASLGCVRLPNDVMTKLHSLVPIGTPVEIKA